MLLQDVNPWVSVTHQGNIADNGLHTGCEVRDPAGVECGESKLAKMACSGSLAPHFLKNDYVTAETIYNTACVHHEVLGHGLLCAVHPCKFHLEKPRRVVRGYVVLWLPHQPGENKLMCSSYGSSHFLPAS